MIVQLHPGGPAPQHLADQTVRQFGGRAGTLFHYAIRGFAAELPQAAINALTHNPNVLAVTPDRVVVSAADQDMPTGYDRTEADLVPRAGVPTSTSNCPTGESCTDVDVAVLDTGVIAHPDLNVMDTERVDCTSLFGLFGCQAGGLDVFGHGTHVAGIAAAFDNDLGVVGIAPGARIWSVKVLQDDGTGTLPRRPGVV